MNFIASMSVTRKLIIAFMFTATITTVVLTLLSVSSTGRMMEEQLEQNELPDTLANIAGEISKEIVVVKNACVFLASDTLMLEWFDRPEDTQTEQLLVNRLNNMVSFFDVDKAGFTDRKTARYWNTDGFLRVLEPDLDNWFFKFRSSGNDFNLSLYTNQDGQTMLFVNYQQVNGRGLSSIGKEASQWRSSLLGKQIRESGFTYIVDKNGEVILHPDADLIGKADLNMLYDGQANQLVEGKDFHHVEIVHNGEPLILARQSIADTEWTLIAQIPRNEVYVAVDNARNQLILFALMVIGVVIIMAWWLASTISKPIQQISNTFKELGAGDGDLSVRLSINNHRELIDLAQGFNDFVGKIDHTIVSVRETSAQLRSQASTVSGFVDSTKQQGQIQLDHTVHVAASIHEVEATVQEIAGSASQAADTADKADNSAQQGVELGEETRNKIIQAKNDVTAVADDMGVLAGDIDSISEILSVINGISEQTNLLALNAAIEAARAGDQGRGFAVVADEVRQLAQRTKTSTKDIEELISHLTRQSSQAVQKVMNSTASTDDSVNSVTESEEKLEHIQSAVSNLKTLNDQVAVATEEQAAVIKEVAENVHRIQAISEETLNNTEQLSHSSGTLVELAEKLDELVQGFKH
ncbi:methyl-accepting chemotaxis protein [Marinibactrum halimedae]|uniref:Methyl-accepting chemotaxis protein n=1 Tax=Marinibactrum halimedae TaxID=1444977 RepID=A0AA37T8U1_9GAMM|nr:methyl-accepting chemotaxis protein [Marinibactrum halimedae]MCD9459115.1 methyl-accepting chemotaxis protein [Marinibactrum halimedae]GLS24717.1 methyl-accepting chemotaxis protein [Marinibactrum halimedae]